jgi:hypothetical protein
MDINQDTSSTAAPSDAKPVDPGPREIMVGPASAVTEPVAKADEPKAPKAEKTEDNDPSGEKQRPNKLQDRIDELTKARREAEREAAYWRARAKTQDEPPKKQGPPVRTDFASDDEFIDAQVDFKLEQKLAQRDSQNAASKQIESQATQWAGKLTAAKALIQDFDAVMNAAELPVENHIMELIREHDSGGLIAYHLANNPAVLEELNKMTPAKAAFRMGKLGDQVEAEFNKPAKAAVSKISSAPPPAKVATSGSNTLPAPQDMDMDQYREYRKKQGAHWA